MEARFSFSDMKTSPLGIKAIAKREGTILHVYKDSKGLPTAGVGHLIKPEEKAAFPLGKKITQAQSDAWLAADLEECETAVNSLGVKLKQHQFDALVSLAFNIGVAGFKRSTVARKLKAGDTAGAAEAILLWDKPPEIQGRRRTEYNQFLHDYKIPATVPAVNPLTTNEGQVPTHSAGNTPAIAPPPETSPAKETVPTDSGAAPNATPADGALSPQVVVKERPSIFTRVMTGIYTAIATALAGIAATCGGNEIATQLATKGGERIVEHTERSDLMTLLLILGYVLGIGGIAVGLFWLASWIYQRSSERANALNREKVIAAAAKDLNTVEFKK